VDGLLHSDFSCAASLIVLLHKDQNEQQMLRKMLADKSVGKVLRTTGMIPGLQPRVGTFVTVASGPQQGMRGRVAEFDQGKVRAKAVQGNEVERKVGSVPVVFESGGSSSVPVAVKIEHLAPQEHVLLCVALHPAVNFDVAINLMFGDALHEETFAGFSDEAMARQPHEYERLVRQRFIDDSTGTFRRSETGQVGSLFGDEERMLAVMIPLLVQQALSLSNQSPQHQEPLNHLMAAVLSCSKEEGFRHFCTQVNSSSFASSSSSSAATPTSSAPIAASSPTSAAAASDAAVSDGPPIPPPKPASSTGSSSTDAGSSSTDAGSSSTGSSSTDAGSSSTDAGSSSTDAGSSSTDAGSSSTDSGSLRQQLKRYLREVFLGYLKRCLYDRHAHSGLQLRSTMIGFFRLSYAVGGREELCLKLTQEVPVALGYFLEGPGFAQDLAQLVSTPSSCAPYPPMIEPFTRRLAQVTAVGANNKIATAAADTPSHNRGHSRSGSEGAHYASLPCDSGIELLARKGEFFLHDVQNVLAFNCNANIRDRVMALETRNQGGENGSKGSGVKERVKALENGGQGGGQMEVWPSIVDALLKLSDYQDFETRCWKTLGRLALNKTQATLWTQAELVIANLHRLGSANDTRKPRYVTPTNADARVFTR
jgi:hypothetical protein